MGSEFSRNLKATPKSSFNVCDNIKYYHEKQT